MRSKAVLTAAILIGLGLGDAIADTPGRLEFLLMLPEPRALRGDLSVAPSGADKTVFSPAREVADVPGIEEYSKEGLKRLGLSVETFYARARATADKLLTSMKPELVRAEDGKVVYAVIRSDRPIVASLVIAPGLAKRFESVFGKEIWVAVPTRRVMYVFPAQPEVLRDFSQELSSRYRNEPHAASPEVFSLRAGEEPRVVATFVD